MTTPTVKRGKQRPKTQPKKWSYFLFLISRSLLSRRLGAWLLEVSLITASAVIPYSLGAYVKSHSQAETVPLNSVLARVEKTKGKIFALSGSSGLTKQVPPLTNFLWSIGLVTPILLTGCQLYLLAKTGQTSPKRWLGIKVVNAAGNPPGWGKTIVREIIARYGLSGVSAYVIWLLVGAAPNSGILWLLFAIILTAEKGMATTSIRYCALHDAVAETIAIDAKKGLTTYSKVSKTTSPLQSKQPPLVEVQSYPYLHQPQTSQTYLTVEETNNQNLIVYTPTSSQKFNLWQWMRSHPGITLLSVASAGIFSVLATVVGTQIYVQTQANQRQVKADNNQVFFSLVNRLSATASDPLTERQSIILSLARLDDPRTVPLLVDLLGQETNPAIVETLQQALVSLGTKTLPHLKRLNQSLDQDLTLENQKAIAPPAVANVITKILSIYSGKLKQVDLSQVNLAPINQENLQFTLSLTQKDLSGINFRAAILNQANFQESKFSNLGKNERITDFSNAHLKGVNFTQATLNSVVLNQSNLTGATLSQSNLSKAQLNQSNLSRVEMIGTNATAAQLQNASLTGANIGNSKFTKANLTGASLGKVKALATNFSQANLAQSNWQGANLTAANLSKANLQQADLSLTQLQEANLTNAQLQNASLVHANLSTADLRGANLDGADFQGVIFAIITPQNSKQFLAELPNVKSMAQIKGVNFSKVKNLNSSQIEFICDRGGIHPRCK